MRGVGRIVLTTAFAVMVAGAPTASYADDKLEGKVVGTNLTLCHHNTPTGGGCEGTLTLETKAEGKAQRVEINVIADTIIRQGQDYLVLPATEGSSVVVSFVTEKGQKIAKSIDVVGAAR